MYVCMYYSYVCMKWRLMNEIMNKLTCFLFPLLCAHAAICCICNDMHAVRCECKKMKME